MAKLDSGNLARPTLFTLELLEIRMRPTLRHKMIALAALAGSLVFASSAAADSLESQWRAACTRDALMHCSLQALSGDRDGVRDCLIAKLPKISSACRGVINAAVAETGPLSPRPGESRQRDLSIR
jgi:hypothetical protein